MFHGARQLEVEVLEARHLHPSPHTYCRLSLDRDGREQKAGAAQGGGGTAVWNRLFIFNLTTVHQELLIKIADSRKFGKNHFLGRVRINLADLSKTEMSPAKWYPLGSKNDTLSKKQKETRGELLLRLRLGVSLSETAMEATHQYRHSKSGLDDSEDEGDWEETLEDGQYPVTSIGEGQLPEELSVFVTSWNVGNSPPPVDLSLWIPPPADRSQWNNGSGIKAHHLYVIGLQESQFDLSKDLSEKTIWSSCKDEWLGVLGVHLGRQYAVLTTVSLREIRLIIFIRKDWEHKVTSIGRGKEATGVANMVGNKGGTAACFSINHTSFCFINCHLAAHQQNIANRNLQIATILDSLDFGDKGKGPDLLNRFHYLFWLGDLNYRLTYGDQGSHKSPSPEQFERMTHLIYTGQYPTLSATDQLRLQMSEHKILHGFEEGNLFFPPTFKMVRGKEHTYDPKRSPAWCDRILWLGAPDMPLKQTELWTCQEVTSSDHTPICATFELHTIQLAPSRDPGKGQARLLLTDLKATDVPGVDKEKEVILSVSSDMLGTCKTVHMRHHDGVLSGTAPVQCVLMANNQTRISQSYLSLVVFKTDGTMLGAARVRCSFDPNSTIGASGEDGDQVAVVPFRGQLTRHGLRAGIVSGTLQVIWQPLSGPELAARQAQGPQIRSAAVGQVEKASKMRNAVGASKDLVELRAAKEKGLAKIVRRATVARIRRPSGHRRTKSATGPRYPGRSSSPSSPTIPE